MPKERFFKPPDSQDTESSRATHDHTDGGNGGGLHQGARNPENASPPEVSAVKSEDQHPFAFADDDVYEIPATAPTSTGSAENGPAKGTHARNLSGFPDSTPAQESPQNTQHSSQNSTHSSFHSTQNSDPDPSMSQIGYDLFKSQIEQIIGSVPESAIRHLHGKYFNRPNYLQLATDEFFSGLVYGDASNADNASQASKNSQNERSNQGLVLDLLCQARTQRMEHIEKDTQSWRRYIGTLDVEAWATRRYSDVLSYQQPLQIKRLTPNKIKKSAFVAAKFGDTAVIRLYTIPGGREIGRLTEEITRILSPLIDLGIAEFEAHVMMENRRGLGLGDSFYLQISCFLNHATFAAQAQYAKNENESPKRRRMLSSTPNFALETEQESVLRHKQKALARLFERLHITQATAANDENTIVVDDSDAEASPQPEASADGLDLDQLKQFYVSNQQSAYLENLPDTTTPPKENFALSLRPYQKHGLAWMLSREKEMDVLEELSVNNGETLSTQRMQAIRSEDTDILNPLWREFSWPEERRRDGSVVHHEQSHFYANLYNGELSLERPTMQSFVKGGILADEMGLGKTISTLALVHSVPYDVDPIPGKMRNYASKSTLIVVPMSLLAQWKNEFEKTNKNRNHTCMVYYGDSVQADLAFSLCHRSENIPIVVLTTYGTVQNEWTRLNKIREENGTLPPVGLFSVEFFRVVLDEGHTIRNRVTKTAKSVHELQSRRKWILTGTPVVNRLDDIFSLVKFLRLEPWGNFSYWKTFVTLPFEQKKFSQTLDVVKAILQPIFLRRTKNMKQKDGSPLVALPEKEVVIEELQFSGREQLLYDFFKSRAYQSFKEGMRTGELLKKYSQILTHILRLRQVCCHPDLIANSNELDGTWDEQLKEYEQPLAAEKFISETAMKTVMYGLYKNVQIDDSECSICTSTPIALGELTLTECGHQYCFHCLMDHINYQKNEGSDPLCPQCRHPISKYRLFKVNRREMSKIEVTSHTNEDLNEPHSTYNFRLTYFNPDHSSAKIQALIGHLRELKEQSPGEQVVVFSQFSTFLDLIEAEIQNLGTDDDQDFVVYKFDGRLNMAEREKILRQFATQNKADGRITILLLSLKAGGVGLNLTVAKRAFMMDPWWSPSIEDQAIDRVHRIGQEHNVKVVRFIVQNSIETKMLRIQERKRKMGEAVEVEEEERRKQRIEEIKLLFDE